MNVYDFDDTIYNGESIVDFFVFCLKKDYRLIAYVPTAIYLLKKYKKNQLDIKELEAYIERFINQAIDIEKYEQYIEEFWKCNSKKLKPQFMEQIEENDIIITGCPSFLFDAIKNKINTEHIICSDFDMKKKKLNFICLGQNKVEILKKRYPKAKINKFYTDSLMDKPLMELANEVFLVNKNKVTKIK